MIRVGRKRDQRDLLIRSLVTSVILYESIVTTKAKAQMVQGTVDRIMTIAKAEDKLAARRRLLGYLLDEKAVNKVMDELVNRMSDRTSGYTRRLRLQNRTGDGAEQVVLQLVHTVLLNKPTKEPTTAKSAAAPAGHEGHDHA